MNVHLDRALLLFQQSRFEMAADEARQAILEDSSDVLAHSVLALCLSESKRYVEATSEAELAIHSGPDNYFGYYAMAHVLYDRNMFRHAQQVVERSIQLNPFFCDGFALLGSIGLRQKRWQDAVDAANQGLQIDPDHTGCLNVRSTALVQLGRRQEAQLTIQEALQHAPEDSFMHANQGWAYMHDGNHQQAMQHFRESLRLEPDSEWARLGVLEAMKARNPVYRIFLKFFLFMSRLSDRGQWGIILGLFLIMQVLKGLGQHAAIRPFVVPIMFAYLAFCLLTWCARPLFNLVLRLDRFGRMVLSNDEIVASNWIGGLLVLSIGSAVGAILLSQPAGLFLSLASVLMLIPVSGVFSADPGWPRRSLIIYAVTLGAVGLIATWSLATNGPRSSTLLGVFLLGVMLFSWFGNFVARIIPTR
ncbi:MAG: tetratricopeptide repeat protein [Pirellulaceae bacterium]